MAVQYCGIVSSLFHCCCDIKKPERLTPYSGYIKSSIGGFTSVIFIYLYAGSGKRQPRVSQQNLLNVDACDAYPASEDARVRHSYAYGDAHDMKLFYRDGARGAYRHAGESAYAQFHDGGGNAHASQNEKYYRKYKK